MKILNVGPLEVIFVVLLALIVLGPKKAVKLAGDVGGWVRKFINSPLWQNILSTSKEIQDLPKRVMDDEEFRKSLEEIEFSSKELENSIIETEANLQTHLSKPQEESHNDNKP